MAIKTLPKDIETYIDNNFTFTRFGIVNLKVIRATTKTELTDTELIKLIDARFSKEIVNGKIEYIGLS